MTASSCSILTHSQKLDWNKFQMLGNLSHTFYSTPSEFFLMTNAARETHGAHFRYLLKRTPSTMICIQFL